MSQLPPSNPNNPYASPQSGPGIGLPPKPPANVSGKLLPPAIVLLLIGLLGFGVTCFNTVFALTAEVEIDPNLPPLVQEMQRSSVGMSAALIQGAFALVNLTIMAGSICMMKRMAHAFCVLACALAMINFGSFCCVLGFPIGIWGVVILFQQDVKDAFNRR